MNNKRAKEMRRKTAKYVYQNLENIMVRTKQAVNDLPLRDRIQIAWEIIWKRWA